MNEYVCISGSETQHTRGANTFDSLLTTQRMEQEETGRVPRTNEADARPPCAPADLALAPAEYCHLLSPFLQSAAGLRQPFAR